MSIFWLCFFSYGKVKDVFNMDQISFGERKRKCKRGVWGEALSEGYFYKIPIIKQDTNFISQTFGQTNFYTLPLQLACWKTYMQRCSSNSDLFFLVKNSFVFMFLKNKYGLQMLKMAWYPKTYTLLTSVHNDLDDADNTGNYKRMIGISKCEQKIVNTHPNKYTHPHSHNLWLSVIKRKTRVH